MERAERYGGATEASVFGIFFLKKKLILFSIFIIAFQIVIIML